jgi:hypothetical protein
MNPRVHFTTSFYCGRRFSAADFVSLPAESLNVPGGTPRDFLGRLPRIRSKIDVLATKEAVK